MRHLLGRSQGSGRRGCGDELDPRTRHQGGHDPLKAPDNVGSHRRSGCKARSGDVDLGEGRDPALRLKPRERCRGQRIDQHRRPEYGHPPWRDGAFENGVADWPAGDARAPREPDKDGGQRGGLPDISDAQCLGE